MRGSQNIEQHFVESSKKSLCYFIAISNDLCMAYTYGLKILETLLIWLNLIPDQFQAILSSPNTSGAHVQAIEVFDTIDRKRQRRFYYHFQQSDQPLFLLWILTK